MDRKIYKVSFNPAKRFADNPKAAKLHSDHSIK